MKSRSRNIGLLAVVLMMMKKKKKNSEYHHFMERFLPLQRFFYQKNSYWEIKIGIFHAFKEKFQ